MIKNMNVSSKLGLGFGVLIILVIILGIISIQKMSHVNDQSTIITENWMPSIKVVEEINTGAADFRIAQYDRILSKTPEGMKKAEKDMEDTLVAIDEDRVSYEKLISSSEEKALYVEFSKQFEKYMEIHKELLVLIKENKIDEAERIMRTTKVSFAESSATLLKLVKINVDGGNKANTDGDEIYSSAKILLISIMIICVILSLLIALFITKS